MAKVSPTVHKKFNTRSSTAAAAAAAAAHMQAVSPKLVQAVAPMTKAVTGVKRGNSSNSANNGPKAKEVKVYRMQQNNNQAPARKSVLAQQQQQVSSSGGGVNKTTGAQLSNGVRKILINTIDMKDLRTIKIINANTLKNPHLKLAAANLLQQSKQGLLPKNAMLAKEQYERQPVKQEVFDEDSGEEQQQVMMSEASYHVKTEDDDDDVDEDSDDEDEYGNR